MKNAIRSISLRTLLRFGCTGILVTFVQILTAMAMLHFATHSVVIANAVAFVLATLVSYTINSLWSFSSPLHGRTLAKFFIVAGIGFIVAVAISACCEALRLADIVAVLGVAIAVPLVTFPLHNFWTFRKQTL